VPFRAILAAKDPNALPSRMRAIENSTLSTPNARTAR
jgi:hypothetical protein